MPHDREDERLLLHRLRSALNGEAGGQRIVPYDPPAVEAYFDQFGEGEWERFDRFALGAVHEHIHNVYLERFVAPGSHVLEIGAGPGRFTQTLHRLGCRIVVADISDVQLAACKELKVMPQGALLVGDGGDDELPGARGAGLEAARALWFASKWPNTTIRADEIGLWRVGEVLDLASAA